MNVAKSQWFNDDQASDTDCGHYERNECVNCKKVFGFAARKESERIQGSVAIGGLWCPGCATMYIHEASR